MPDRYSVVLFDLDGTIMDSAPGIIASLAHTFREMGRPVPSDASLLRWVGPPILDSFRDFAGFDEATSERALTIYRAHYRRQGALDAAVYPGMADLLRAVHRAGIPTSLATSKPESQARPIVDHFGLLEYLDETAGASDDELLSTKADVVAEALRRLALRGVDLSRPVMVGDRHHDIEGAAEHGIPTIAVSWGYGSPSEWGEAVAVADSPDDLYRLLGIDA